MTVTTPSDIDASLLDAAELDASGAAAEAALDIPEEVPAADDSGSRPTPRSSDDVGFTLDEFASLLSKYDYNFKPGDVVNGTVFALESKGAMIDIGAKTAAFMPLQEVSINRVEGLADVLEPGEVREFFILS
ncbi:MAG: S1 RNA-binding domain-containing protein, partial [Prochlorococcaceae cyanobacterium]